MCLFVHAQGTSGMDYKERRDHEYSDTCSQCGVVLTPTTRVAAHVVAYPAGNCCIGAMTLKTTCKKCNNYRNESSSFWDFDTGIVGMRMCGPLERFTRRRGENVTEKKRRKEGEGRQPEE